MRLDGYKMCRCDPEVLSARILKYSRRKNRRPEGRRLKVSGSGDDAPMLASEVGVGRDRSRRREVEIALEREPQGSAGG
jgi:hypothetical protein